MQVVKIESNGKYVIFVNRSANINTEQLKKAFGAFSAEIEFIFLDGDPNKMLSLVSL